ncbi:hypothetical protein QBC42DRAFT_333443 [Cladorrhinum samala]|uniref:Uncharacterized protein n=1 Tax=Cladorrhinum samala TaxID=585594 RepID=A0AAV9HHC8_9PEZI|nr:hypothetical protein QBC42DRAFT_333443 [Cladorrhinum samala]
MRIHTDYIKNKIKEKKEKSPGFLAATVVQLSNHELHGVQPSITLHCQDRLQLKSLKHGGLFRSSMAEVTDILATSGQFVELASNIISPFTKLGEKFGGDETKVGRSRSTPKPVATRQRHCRPSKPGTEQAARSLQHGPGQLSLNSESSNSLLLALQLILLEQVASDIRGLPTHPHNNHLDVEGRCLRELFITDPTADHDAIISAKGEMVSNTCG